jgi:glycosyltransferase involved in cell wall biosynthesis
MRWYIPFVLRKVDVGIVLGEKLRPVLHGLVKKIVVVPNGSSFAPAVQQRGRDTNSVTVAYLGTLMRAKGVIDLLEAAWIVVASHPHVRFRFAGEWWAQEPDTKEEALRLVAEHGLHGHIEFVGKMLGEEKERFLLESDMLVFPTWIDSFGMVNIEAMAAGCPVISTKGVGAIEEVVLDGETGILVDKQNPRQLATAINRLVEDPGLRKRMGEAGRDRFESLFTNEKCIDKMVGVFNAVLERRQR